MTTSTRSGDNLRLIHELMPAAEKLVERHISSAKEWFPHLYVPWSRGRDFEPDEAWDPAEFPDPDHLDIAREPNHHLTFSHGMHYCLGAALARVEGRVAIGSLVSRFPNIERVTEELRYRDHFVLRGLEELRVSV